MKRTQKEQLVSELKGTMEGATALYFTDFTGLNVKRMTELRRRLRIRVWSGAQHRRLSLAAAQFSLRIMGSEQPVGQRDVRYVTPERVGAAIERAGRAFEPESISAPVQRGLSACPAVRRRLR